MPLKHRIRPKDVVVDTSSELAGGWPRAAQGDSCDKGASVWQILPGQIFEGIYPTPKVIEVRGFSRTGRYGVYAESAYVPSAIERQ